MHPHHTARWIRMVTVAVSAVLLTACGVKADPVDPPPDGKVGAPPSAAPSEPRLVAPADACTVLPADLAATLKVTKSRRTGSSPRNCTWELDSGDKYKGRTIGVEYEAWDDPRLAKSMYDSTKRSDMAGGRGANITIAETAEVRQVGSQQQGQHFDEAYYFYGSAEIAGSTLGNGTVVIRRGNVTVVIVAQGSDILPPYTGKLRSNPLASAEAKEMIDRTADVLAGAVKAG